MLTTAGGLVLITVPSRQLTSSRVSADCHYGVPSRVRSVLRLAIYRGRLVDNGRDDNLVVCIIAIVFGERESRGLNSATISVSSSCAARGPGSRLPAANYSISGLGRCGRLRGGICSGSRAGH